LGLAFLVTAQLHQCSRQQESRVTLLSRFPGRADRFTVLASRTLILMCDQLLSFRFSNSFRETPLAEPLAELLRAWIVLPWQPKFAIPHGPGECNSTIAPSRTRSPAADGDPCHFIQ